MSSFWVHKGKPIFCLSRIPRAEATSAIICAFTFIQHMFIKELNMYRASKDTTVSKQDMFLPYWSLESMGEQNNHQNNCSSEGVRNDQSREKPDFCKSMWKKDSDSVKEFRKHILKIEADTWKAGHITNRKGNGRNNIHTEGDINAKDPDRKKKCIIKEPKECWRG